MQSKGCGISKAGDKRSLTAFFGVYIIYINVGYSAFSTAHSRKVYTSIRRMFIFVYHHPGKSIEYCTISIFRIMHLLRIGINSIFYYSIDT